MTSPTREELARQAVRKVKEKLPLLFTDEGSRQFFTVALESADVELLVDLAREGHREALDLLRKRARQWHREALGTGQSELKVPNSMLQLLLEIFIHGPPKAKTGPKDRLLRTQAIAAVVRAVHENFGFPVYTRPEHRGDPDAPMTATRLVGEELGLDERTVEDILGKSVEQTAPG